MASGCKVRGGVDLKRHLLRPSEKHICEICNMSFPKASQLTNHKIFHSYATQKCHLCPKSFFSKQALYLHLGNVHRDPKTLEEHRKFQQRMEQRRLRGSMKRFPKSETCKRSHVDGSRSRARCQPNKKVTEFERPLEESQNAEKLVLKCPICGKCFSTIDDVQDHLHGRDSCFRRIKRNRDENYLPNTLITSTTDRIDVASNSFVSLFSNENIGSEVQVNSEEQGLMCEISDFISEEPDEKIVSDTNLGNECVVISSPVSVFENFPNNIVNETKIDTDEDNESSESSVSEISLQRSKNMASSNSVEYSAISGSAITEPTGTVHKLLHQVDRNIGKIIPGEKCVYLRTPFTVSKNFSHNTENSQIDSDKHCFTSPLEEGYTNVPETSLRSNGEPHSCESHPSKEQVMMIFPAITVSKKNAGKSGTVSKVSLHCTLRDHSLPMEETYSSRTAVESEEKCIEAESPTLCNSNFQVDGTNFQANLCKDGEPDPVIPHDQSEIDGITLDRKSWVPIESGFQLPKMTPHGMAPPIRLYQCKLCMKAFRQRGSLKWHIVAHTDDITEQRELYLKGLNNKQYISATEDNSDILSTIFTSFMMNSKTYGEFPTKVRRIFPNYQSENPVQNNSKSGRHFLCQFCSRAFPHREELLMHMRMHLD